MACRSPVLSPIQKLWDETANLREPEALADLQCLIRRRTLINDSACALETMSYSYRDISSKTEIPFNVEFFDVVGAHLPHCDCTNPVMINMVSSDAEMRIPFATDRRRTGGSGPTG